jgi:multicomponent Na+:H+ antiporter subunit B
MIKRILVILSLVLLVFALVPFVRDIVPREDVGGTSEEYVEEGPETLGAGNLVTSVVVTYRGLDTLGEVAVLFLAASGVGLLLKRKSREDDQPRKEEHPERGSSEILRTASGFLMPLLILFGTYIFMHGHLTPGGGFQGGVVIASAFLLVFLSRPGGKAGHAALEAVESLSGTAYVAAGILGLVFAAGFLDSRILPLGEFGSLLSAGSIPIVYSLIGLKVGSELTGILDTLRSRNSGSGGEA